MYAPGHGIDGESMGNRSITCWKGILRSWWSMPITGISEEAAQGILAEIGIEMHQLPAARHLASWADVCPGNHESAGKRLSGKTRKGNPYLRHVHILHNLSPICQANCPWLSNSSRYCIIRQTENSGGVHEELLHRERSDGKTRTKKSTFYDLIKRGDIPEGIVLPLRRHALYPKTTIDDLAEERARILGEYEQEPERLQFVIPTSEDFEQIIEIDSTLFPEETRMSAEALQRRLPYNPEVTHVLKDRNTHTVLGYISMSPLKQDILERLITLQVDETELQPEHFTPYLVNTPLDCYIVSVGARVGAGIAQHFYAGKLACAVKSYLIELLEKGVIIRRIYAVATSREGERLALSLSFTPLATMEQWQSADEDFRHPYVLDLEDRNSQSKLVKEYQRYKMNRE
jgi:hypothetical protein